MDTRTADELRNLQRSVAELQSKVARLPVREGKVRPNVVSVFEFVHCTDAERKLYVDNVGVASHLPGGADELAPVAAIKIDGVIDCWRLVGRAPQCKTGECVEILGWGYDCDACASCFLLHPCDSGDDVIVRGVEWMEYLGRVVAIDAGVGVKCYEVSTADSCEGVDEDVQASDVLASTETCDGCGCYELENCATAATMFVTDDLGGLLGLDPADVVGKIIEVEGVCWEVIDFHSPCGESAPDTFGLTAAPKVKESCGDCCFELTPCPGQSGSPTAFKVRPEPDDYDLSQLVKEDGTSNGKAIMLAGYVCYTVSRPEDCTGAVTGLATVLEVFDSCECCGVTCWKECGTSTHIRTYADLCAYKRSGVALKRAEDGKCYEYQSSPGTCGTPAIVAFTVEDVYEHEYDACAICQDPRFKLTPSCESGCSDCAGGETGGEGPGGSPIVTDDEAFADLVGQYVKMEGVCYLVELTTDPLAGTVGCWTGPYTSCAACSEAPTQLTLVAQRDGEIVGLKVEGPLRVCGTVDVTDDCPTESAAPNSYAFASLM